MQLRCFDRVLDRRWFLLFLILLKILLVGCVGLNLDFRKMGSKAIPPRVHSAALRRR